MSDRDQHAVHGWRQKLPLALGIGAFGLLFVYLVFPGFIIGLLFRTNLIDPTSDDSSARDVLKIVFVVPIYLSEKARPIRLFYEWQSSVVRADR